VRPHRLQLTAFGPFAGTVEVDLDALAANGLFLLRGETGAGKTTLLDALGFALFGQVPGVRQKTKRLRSDHAPEQLRTSVQLEVSLAGRRLRITRSPQQERRKSRGQGSTTEQAKVLLEELVGAQWLPLSTRIDETAAELEPLLGMSAAQFFQVVLLPQGEFAQFLRADSKDRGELLERLFGTARFGAVEQWLEGRRRDTGREVALARSAVDVLSARVGQAAGAQPPTAQAGSWAAALLGQARRRSAACHRDLQARDTERARARRAGEQAGALAARQARRQSLLARSAALADAVPAAAALRAELAAATRAAGLSGAFAEQSRRTRTTLWPPRPRSRLGPGLRPSGWRPDWALPCCSTRCSVVVNAWDGWRLCERWRSPCRRSAPSSWPRSRTLRTPTTCCCPARPVSLSCRPCGSAWTSSSRPLRPLLSCSPGG